MSSSNMLAGIAEQIIAGIREIPPRSGNIFVLAIDGRSGSGKSRLAQEIAGRIDGTVLEVEDFIPGWRGLVAGVRKHVAPLIHDLRADGIARARRWDWYANAWGEVQTVRAKMLILSGCGSSAPEIGADLTVWLEAPEPVRKERVAHRDPYDWEEIWPVWAAQETELFKAFPADQRADFIFQTAQ